MGLKVLLVSFLGSFRSHGVCATVHIRRCRGHAVWTLVSATCSLHLTVSPLVGAYAVRSDPPSYAYTDDSPGLGSLVGREFAQSLGARLLVSVLHSMGPLILLITL